MDMIKKTFKRIFKVKWNDEHNIIQNIFYNFYMPDSKGKLSMHVTLLVLTGVIPVMVTLGVEVYRVIESLGKDDPFEFSTGFWAIIGTLATATTAALSLAEGHKRKINGSGTTTGGTGVPGEASGVTVPPILRNKDQSSLKIPRPQDLPTDPDLEKQ